MKKLLLLFATILFTFAQVEAQEAPAVSDTLDGWKFNWTTGLNGSQSSYSNWSGGGVDNISVAGNSDFTAKYRQNRYSYAFALDTRYGESRIDGEGTRKTDDLFSIRNRFLYDIGGEESEFSIFGNLNFRTQFAKGYRYGEGIEGDELTRGDDRLISDFMAPAYITQNAGLAYSPGDHFYFEAGVGLRQTIVSDERLSTTYGLDEGTRFRNEAGVNLGADYSQTIASNLVLNSTIETFTNVNKSVRSTDVFFSNQVTGRINRVMNASFRLDLAYDDDFSTEVQVRQVISMGISFILI